MDTKNKVCVGLIIVLIICIVIRGILMYTSNNNNNSIINAVSNIVNNVGGNNTNTGTNHATATFDQLPERLRVVNNASQAIWIATQDESNTLEKNVKILPGEYHDYRIPEEGLAATRIWPKLRCAVSGDGCDAGQSIGPCIGPCQPPIDSKFEATWGSLTGAGEPVTWYNGSLVDGWTIAFNIITRTAPGDDWKDCHSPTCPINPGMCPEHEDLSSGGQFPELSDVDLRYKDGNGNVVGCWSPCAKLTYPPDGGGLGYANNIDEPRVKWYCCPEGTDPDECRSGPISTTKYMDTVTNNCPLMYGYSYDDDGSLWTCQPPTKFIIEFYD